MSWAATAQAQTQAQVGSFCLRPLGIPDKWIERQTPPWDPTDTFDPTGSNPDVYYPGGAGFNPLEDHGRAMSLVLYNRTGAPQGQSALPISVSEPGSAAFFDALVACSGYPHGVGESFPILTGGLTGPFGAGMAELIAQDPAARWDPNANGGRGGVVGSGFTQSPRVLALPVFAPDAYAGSSSMSPAMVKIVGFFVSQRVRMADGSYTIQGHLTGWSQLTAAPVTARSGEWAQLSATFTGPGSPIMGQPVEFLYNDMVVAMAQTDGTGTARPATTSFQAVAKPGYYPGALRVRLQESSSFFLADETVADLTVLKRLPSITWLPSADISYGTPLGPQQLNAVADVAGVFTYTPAAGAVLPVSGYPEPLSATFVPAEEESLYFDQTTASSYVTVVPAPLTVTVNNVSKLYLDPLPAFSFSAAGFVNGEDTSALSVSPNYLTSATDGSPVGAYPVTFEWVAAQNYALTLKPGVLTVVSRPTTTVLQSSGPSPSTYGQAVSFTIAVSSGRGVPGGSVTVMSGGVPVAPAPLVDGRATVAVSSLGVGAHSLTAAYSGGGGFESSSSSAVTHTVNASSTTTGLSSSLNPSRTGQPVTFTATVIPVAPGGGGVAGSVEFRRAGVVIATVPLSGGRAQLTTDTLAAGKHDIQARYLGTANHLSSVSAVVQQSVKGGGK